jgi:hypothetical protein
MRNRQVPRAEWFKFFESFSRRHEGWLSTVRVLDPRFGAQIEVENLPLSGIVADPEGRGPVSFWLGRGSGPNLEHAVENPEQVWVELTESGAEAALEIASADGLRTILEFRSALLPEMVDGLAGDASGA